MAYVNDIDYDLFIRNLTADQKTDFIGMQYNLMNDFIQYNMGEDEKKIFLEKISKKQQASLSKKQLTFTKKITECTEQIERINAEIEEHQQKIAQFNRDSHKYTTQMISSLTRDHLYEIQKLNEFKAKLVKTLESHQRKLSLL